MMMSSQWLSAETSNDVVHTVDFSQSSNLKTIFDAGLRPWHLQGLENMHCELGNENLKIILPGNVSISIIAGNVDVSVLAGNDLSSFDVFCESEPLDVATKQAKVICQSIGVATNRLDDYIRTLNSPGSKTLGWAGDTTINGIDVQVRLQLVPSMQGARAEVMATIIWPHPDETMKFLTEPIKPPPGYENISMEPPPLIPHSPSIPEHDSNYYRNQALQARDKLSSGTALIITSSSQATVGASSSAAATQSPNLTSVPSESSATAPQASPSASRINPWYGLLAILLIIATVYALRKK